MGSSSDCAFVGLKVSWTPLPEGLAMSTRSSRSAGVGYAQTFMPYLVQGCERELLLHFHSFSNFAEVMILRTKCISPIIQLFPSVWRAGLAWSVSTFSLKSIFFSRSAGLTWAGVSWPGVAWPRQNHSGQQKNGLAQPGRFGGLDDISLKSNICIGLAAWILAEWEIIYHNISSHSEGADLRKNIIILSWKVVIFILVWRDRNTVCSGIRFQACFSSTKSFGNV